MSWSWNTGILQNRVLDDKKPGWKSVIYRSILVMMLFDEIKKKSSCEGIGETT